MKRSSPGWNKFLCNQANKKKMKEVGAVYLGNGRCTFTVWAPEKKSVKLHLVRPTDKFIEMEPDEWGYFRAEVENINPGDQYFFIPDGKKDLPDPASHYQSEGVHGPSSVVDHSDFKWNDS